MLDLKYQPKEPTPAAKTELELTAEKLGVTPAKLKAMRDYAASLRSIRGIKKSKIRSLVLQKFKIHLT